MDYSAQPNRKWGRGWVLLCLAFGLHVLDEAVNDFLALYNPTVEQINEAISFLSFPTFSFEGWITGLAVAIIILLLLSNFAYRGKSWMKPLSYLFAAVMLLNGILHIIGSLGTGRVIPGTWSSPVLLLSAGYLISVLLHLPGES